MGGENESTSANKTQAHKYFRNIINWSGSSKLSRTENSTGPSVSLLTPTSTQKTESDTSFYVHDSQVALLLYSNTMKYVKCHSLHIHGDQINSSSLLPLTRAFTAQILHDFSHFFNLISSLLHYSIQKSETHFSILSHDQNSRNHCKKGTGLQVPPS